MEKLTPENKKRLQSKEWRINHLYKIVDKNKKLITFKEKEVQKRFNDNAHSRNIILKSRQHGFTTNACVDGLDDVLFNRNFKFTIIADTLEHAVEIFEKIKIAWQYFPLKDWYSPNSDTTRQLMFNNGSVVRVTTSARSATVNRLHISELGAIAATEPKKAKEIITGSIPAVPKDGRVDVESTAKGETGAFFEMCQKAMKQEAPESKLDFKFHFFGWLEDDDCSLKGDFDIPEELKEYQERYDIPEEKMNWYYQQSKILGAEIRQEYPTYPDEAFMYSGRKMFDQNMIAGMMKKAERGEKQGSWIYYEEYKEGHLYGLGADVSEGIGKDSNAICVWDFTPIKPKVVAVYYNNQIAPDLFAYEIKNGGEKYGMAMAGIERNNPGHATLTELKKIYPGKNIFKEVRTDKLTDKKTERLGWNTTLTTKPKMMYDLRRAVSDDLVEIPSKPLLEEMRTYDLDDLQNVKAKEEQTQHWDLLIAAAIGFQMRNHLVEIKREVKQYIPKYDEPRFAR